MLAFVDLEDNILWLDIFNLLIDICFMIDVLVSFRTTYIIDKTGEEVSSISNIAMK